MNLKSLCKSISFGVFAAFSFVSPSYAAYYYWVGPTQHSTIHGKVHHDLSGDQYKNYIWNQSIFTNNIGSNFQPFANWNVGDFTRFYVNTISQPLNTFQVGSQGVGYGGTAFQLQGSKFGAQLHTWSMPNFPEENRGIKTVNFGSDVDIRPWDSQRFGSNAKFCFGHYLAVPSFYSAGAVMYAGTNLYINDGAGKGFSVGVSSWDSRGPSTADPEQVNIDPGNGNYTAVWTRYGGTKYTTLSAGSSAEVRGQTFSSERWFGFCITRTNLRNIISDARARGLFFSENISNYQITSYSIQAEINKLVKIPNNPNGYDGWFSLTARDIWLLTEY